VDDWAVRAAIYDRLAATGRAPTVAEIAEWVGDADQAKASLRRLHDAHLIVLDDVGEILMALPFSAVATAHRVVAGSRSWWANCAWDSLAIPAALGVDADIEAEWMDTGEPVGLRVVDGRLERHEDAGFVHFERPAARWWDDIVET
jgi:hypothetical protein